MAYRLTEANRKHITPVEDTEVKLLNEDGKYFLSIKDTDDVSNGLNFKVELPSNKFKVSAEDDVVSAIHLVDDNGVTIDCTGYDNNGIGWRFKLSADTDDSGFVKSLILTNLNNGKTNVISLDKIKALEVETLTVDSDASFKSDVSVKNLTAEKETVTSSDIATLNVTAETADSSTIKNLKAEKLDLVGTDGTDKQESTIKNQNLSISNSTVKSDSTAVIELDNASVDNLTSNTLAKFSNEEVANSKIEKAEIKTVAIDSLNATTASVTGKLSADIISGNSGIINDGLVVKTLKAYESVNTKAVKSDTVDATTSTVTNQTVSDTLSAKTVNATAVKSTGNIEAGLKVTAKDGEFSNSVTVPSIAVTKADVLGTATVSKVKTNQMLSQDGAIVAKFTKSTSAFGSLDKTMTLKTTSDSTLSETDENYGHIPAYIDGKKVYLANYSDIAKNSINGIVDRTTNQNISGVKTFNDVIMAPLGVATEDEDSNGNTVIKNIISHVEDFNDSTSIKAVNPTYTKAKAAKDDYDSLSGLYDSTKEAKENIAAKNTEITAAEADLTTAKAKLSTDESTKETYEASIKENQDKYDAIENGTAYCDSTTTTYYTDAKTAAATALSDYDTAKAASDAAYADLYTNKVIKASEIDEIENMVYAFATGSYSSAFADSFSSHTKASSADWTVQSAITEIKTLQTLFSSFISQSSAIASDESVVKTLQEINSELSSLQSIQSTYLTAYNTAANTTALKNTVLEKANALVAHIEGVLLTIKACISLTASNIEATEATITTDNADIATITAKIASLNDELTSLTNVYNSLLAQFIAAYKTVTGDELTELPIELSVEEPVKPQVVKDYEAGLISSTVYVATNELYVGNSQDIMKVESKGITVTVDGKTDHVDEHIEETIEGKAHMIANADDIIAKNVMGAFDETYTENGVEKTDPGKIVGDIKAEVADGAVTLKMYQAPIVTGYEGIAIPEGAEPVPSKVEKSIATIKGGETIKISKDANGNVVFELNDAAVGNIQIGRAHV